MNRRQWLAAVAALAAAGCGSRRPRNPYIDVAAISERRRSGDPIIRIACVGDSITFGAGIDDREKKSYPAQLGLQLGPRFDVRNFGRNGATAGRLADLPYWTTEEFKAAQAFKPDVVIVMLGTNDTKPQNWKGKETFAKDWTDLVRRWRSFESRPKVWVCSPPPVYMDRFGIAAATLDSVLEVIEQSADRIKAPVIDINDTLSGHPEMFSDGIHPNADGASLIARTIYQAIRP